MEYLPTRPNPEKLCILTREAFKEVPRPVVHFSSWLPHYDAEFTASENLNLETATIEQIKLIYESNTFYSIAGYKHRIPRMFSLLVRLGIEANRLDFCNTFFGINVCVDDPEKFKDYTDIQKYCVWLIHDCLDLHFDDVSLFDHDAKRINREKGTSLEVVIQDGVETLSTNLFGTTTPPMALIREFGTSVIY